MSAFSTIPAFFGANHLRIVPIETARGAVVVMSRLFEPESETVRLDLEYGWTLDSVTQWLRANPSYSVVVMAHQGLGELGFDEAYALTQAQASRVKRDLEAKGIARGRVGTMAFGTRIPRYPLMDEDNNRIELLFKEGVGTDYVGALSELLKSGLSGAIEAMKTASGYIGTPDVSSEPVRPDSAQQSAYASPATKKKGPVWPWVLGAVFVAGTGALIVTGGAAWLLLKKRRRR